MNETTGIVRDFLAAFGKSPAADAWNLRRYLTDDAKFHTGIKQLHSLQEAIDHLASAVVVYGVASFRARDCIFAAEGNRVFNERMDDLLDAEGRLVTSVGLASVFELKDGRISKWRDYFNPDVLRAALESRDFRPGF